MRRFLVVIFLALLLAILALMPAGGTPPRSYRPPVEHNGMVFPVATTGYYSVVNFSKDWGAPRLRRVGNEWLLIGTHEGNDIYAEPGTPIRAVLGGNVEQLGWTFYSGWRVGIRGDDGQYWFYAHISRFEPGLGIGQRVESGDTIGAIGNTGYGDNPGHKDEFTYHLHLGVQATNGEWVNPYPLLRTLYKKDVAARS
jgi:murein DD-endopeptidase MepM/ murein hydrolase activator NlpD